MSIADTPFIPTYEEVMWQRTTEKSSISTVISLLPVSLQSRMSPFKSSRRAASLGSIRTDDRLVCTSSALSAEKPRPILGRTTSAAAAAMRSLSWVSSDGTLTPGGSSGAGSEDGMSSGTLTPSMECRVDSSHAIHWKIANQGSSLIGMAAEAGAEGQSMEFQRKAFVDGLTYLLRSLPADLDVYEAEQIRVALPSRLRANYDTASRSEFIANQASIARDGHTAHHNHGPAQANDYDQRSLVHRVVQLLVANIFLAIHFALPYLILLVKSVASVERRYKVSETVVGHGLSLAGAAGRQSAQLAGAVLGLNDGKVRQGLSRAVAWTVEEVTRGISDGVGEGLVMTRLKTG